MKLSVVILNYNVRYFLEQCIRSVEKAIASLDAEIIIIDNASADDSCAMVKEVFPHLRLIENKENVGFSKANNQAVAVAKGQYVCILNPDTAVEEETFVRALKYAEATQNVGALGVFLMDGTGNFLPESKRNLPTPKVSLLKLLGFGKKYYASDIAETGSGKVEVLVGAFMLIKKEVYNRVKGFDEEYFMYGEDIDLSYKISQSGHPNHYLGETTVLHYKGESTKRDARYYDRFYGAMEIFYGKHFSKNRIVSNLVSVAVWCAKNLQKVAANSKAPAEHFIDNYVIVSTDEVLKEKISVAMQKGFALVSPADLPSKNFEHSLVVFDAEVLSYTDIFAAMKRMQKGNNHFRIRPPQCNFILGSDQSDEKGVVVDFS